MSRRFLRRYGFVVLGALILAAVAAALLLRHRSSPERDGNGLRYVAFTAEAASEERAWYPPIAGAAKMADSQKCLIFGRVLWRKPLAQEKVPLSALWLSVDEKKLLAGETAFADHYVLWQTASAETYVGKVVRPAVVEFYHPVEIVLAERIDKRLRIRVSRSDADDFPLPTEGWYELEDSN